MNWYLVVAVFLITIAGCSEQEAATTQVSQSGAQRTIYDFSVKDIDGKEVSLSAYRGDVVLIVNVASRCGFTPQYGGLQSLYKTYKDKGLVVLGFPANNFMGQEPGSDQEIKAFCTTKYHVTFPMFSKISVEGKDQAPLYAFLTDKRANPTVDGKISWNFNKFLIGRDGKVIRQFGSRTAPDNPELVGVINQALAKTS
jgi:glutathione peroxidase